MNTQNSRKFSGEFLFNCFVEKMGVEKYFSILKLLNLKEEHTVKIVKLNISPFET